MDGATDDPVDGAAAVEAEAAGAALAGDDDVAAGCGGTEVVGAAVIVPLASSFFATDGLLCVFTGLPR